MHGCGRERSKSLRWPEGPLFDSPGQAKCRPGLRKRNEQERGLREKRSPIKSSPQSRSDVFFFPVPGASLRLPPAIDWQAFSLRAARDSRPICFRPRIARPSIGALEGRATASPRSWRIGSDITSQPQDILHRIQARLLAGDPGRSPQRPNRKGVATGRPMR